MDDTVDATVQQCQDEVWTPTVCQILSIRTLLVRRVPQVYDMLALHQFQDCITTATPTTQAVSAHKERHDRGKDAKTSAFKTKWNTNRPLLELQRLEQDDHAHPGRKIEVETMFCTWCEPFHKNGSHQREGTPNVWVFPHGCQRFRIG